LYEIAAVEASLLPPKKIEIGFTVIEPHTIVYVVEISGDRMPGYDRLTVCPATTHRG
jgi:hypothetical protein